MRFAGHCWRAKQEITSDLLLWSPNYGKRRVGRPAITYIDQLCRDTGCLPNDLPTLLQDRDGWSDRLMNEKNARGDRPHIHTGVLFLFERRICSSDNVNFFPFVTAVSVLG